MLRSELLRLLLVWIVILGTSAAAVAIQSFRSQGGEAAGLAHASSGASEAVPPVSLQSEIVGKMTIAIDALRRWSPTIGAAQVLGNAEPLGRTDAPFADRVGYTVLVGEVEGWDAGLARLRALPAEVGAQSRLQSEVSALMEALRQEDAAPTAAPALDASARADLESTLGYFARLLLPETRAEALGEGGPVLLALLAFGSFYVLAFLGGCVALLVLVLLVATRRVVPAFAPAPTRDRAIVLGEAFAAWMLGFLALSVGGHLLGEMLPLALGDSGTPLHVARLLVSIAAFVGSLAAVPAVLWARGVGFAEFRALVGLHAGRGVARECLQGILCYVTSVPLLAVGLVLYFVLSQLWRLVTGAAPAPSHPVVEQLAAAGAAEVAILFLMASVAAPLVEEIAFRGMLYGHLRGVAMPRSRLVSAAIAAVASSFIFAVIHPQGALFVPALGGLAVGFCISREIRGSLVAPMVAHGIQNAVTLAIALTVLG